MFSLGSPAWIKKTLSLKSGITWHLKTSFTLVVMERLTLSLRFFLRVQPVYFPFESAKEPSTNMISLFYFCVKRFQLRCFSLICDWSSVRALTHMRTRCSRAFLSYFSVCNYFLDRIYITSASDNEGEEHFQNDQFSPDFGTGPQLGWQL